MAALAALLSGLTLVGAPCEMPGEWPHTRDAGWLWQTLQRAGYHEPGCTGSAFLIDYGGRGLYGHDLYISAGTSPRLAPEFRRFRTIARVSVYGFYEHRAVWRAGRRNVWVEAGPTSHRLPRARVLAPIVRETVRR